MSCEAELCGNWTGDGCICGVLGLVPDLYNDDGSKRRPEVDEEDEDEDDGN